MKYGRLLTRLYNQPLAIAQSKLDILTSEVTLKLLAGETLPTLDSKSKENTFTGSPAIINVFDTLVSKNGVGDSGSTSYESVTRQINQAISTGQQKILFYIDSSGGEVSGLFALAAFIASLPTKHGIETVAVTDGMAASAAYVLASSAQKLYATSSSILGSIGVIMTLVNVTEADKQAGIKYTVLRSKADKALLNPHEDFTPKAIEDAVKMLSELDNIMNEAIMSSRKMLSKSVIDSLAGSTVLAEEALSLGLIDGIVTSLDDVINTEIKINTITNKKDNNMTLEEALAKNIELSSELQAVKANQTLEISKAKLSEQTRIVSILEAASTFNLSTDFAVKRIKANSSVEDAVEMFEGIKEALQMSNSLDTSIAAQSTLNEEMLAKNVPEDFLSSLIGAVDKIQSQDLYKGVK
jgi:ClpP class serine protease